MRLTVIIALGALALTFALSGCSKALAAEKSTDKTADTSATKSADTSATKTEDTGDIEVHRKTIMSHVNEFNPCYQSALKRHPGLAGEITLSWDVDSAGDVIKEDVIKTNTTIGDKAMIECMLERVHTWKFDVGPKNEVSTVTYPFYFTAPLK